KCHFNPQRIKLSTLKSKRFSACQAAPADILFLLDSSGSEGSYNFELQKNFVSKFVTFLNIGPYDAQVSVGTFSTIARSFIRLNSYHDQYSLLNAIAGIPYTAGGTNTHFALDMAEHYTFTSENGDRPQAPNIVYILTDGQSNNIYLTHQAAQHLKGTGAKVFAIGIGHVSTSELTDIATDHEHVFTVDSFSDLPSIQHLVQATYCDVINGTLCIDKISSCYKFSKSTCLDPSYVAFMQMNCPDYCGFCQFHTPVPPTKQMTTIQTTKSISFLPMTTTTLPLNTNKPTTSTIKTSTLKGPVPQHISEGPCVDKISNCAAYGDTVCTNYRLWAIENCARFCIFCHDKITTPTIQTSIKTTIAPSTTQRVYDVCEDKIARCSTYGTDICAKYASWAAIQCPKFCRFCNSSTNSTMSNTIPPTSDTSTSTTISLQSSRTDFTNFTISNKTISTTATKQTTSTLSQSTSASTQYTTDVPPSTTSIPPSSPLDTKTSLLSTTNPCRNVRNDCADLAITEPVTSTPTITRDSSEQSPQTTSNLIGVTSSVYSSTMSE
ncbi:mucin-2-like, partial [Saccostrea cucullata]|uniref:mucin-2-like n=1 Tax=Saccostrea cuccullata TaxID=36930 RepID=UPI002ED3C89F